MSFIDLKLILDHAHEQGMLKPGDLLCPIMSSVSIAQAPMDSEPSLSLKHVICAKEACGTFRRCFNLPPEQHYDLTTPPAAPNI